jgi:Papain family cysteine protease
MSSELGGIVASIDLRHHWTGVRDQGSRPACLACAASDCHSHAQSLAHRLSAEYLFYFGAQRMPGGDHSGGLTFDAADEALRNDGQPDEAVWPYQATVSKTWTPPKASKLWLAAMTHLNAQPTGIVDALRLGRPVILGIRLVPGFNRVQTPPHIINPRGRAAGGHAVLVVGAGRSPTSSEDDLLMIRNSWGFAWGAGGHAWLPVEYLKDRLIGSCVLDAAGVQQEEGVRHVDGK